MRKVAQHFAVPGTGEFQFQAGVTQSDGSVRLFGGLHLPCGYFVPRLFPLLTGVG